MTGIWLSPHIWMYLKKKCGALRACHRKTPNISNKVRSKPRQREVITFPTLYIESHRESMKLKDKCTSFVPSEQEGSRQQPDAVHQRSTVSVSIVPDVPLHPRGLLKANLNVYKEKNYSSIEIKC